MGVRIEELPEAETVNDADLLLIEQEGISKKIAKSVLVTGGGSGTPGGSDTQVQYNDGGAFGGDAGFTYNDATNTLTVENIVSDTFDGYQPIDADLTALAGLTSAADKVPYFTGSNTAALADFTTFGRTLAGLADASAGRTALGVVIGTNVQAYDADLSAIAGLTSAADKVPYFTGAGTAATADFTSFGRTLAALADASAGRTALGVAIGSNVQAYDALLDSVSALSGPGADRILFWDESAGAFGWLVANTNLAISGTDLNATGGGGGTPGGSDTQVQFNDGGSFGGDAGMTWNKTTNALTITGAFSASNVSGTTSGTNTGDQDLSGYQPLDADLTALSGLTSAADRVAYYTGSGTAALATFSSFGRSIVAGADAAAVRTTIGVVIGTNVQAYDADLAALAGVTSAADKVPYFTGSGTASVADFTSFGRTLAALADASAGRTALGVAIGTNVQAYDATLAALASFNSNGLMIQTALDTFAALKLNLAAGTAPTTTDDGAAGYSIGSRWIDTSNDKEYVCVDSTNSAAVWKETSNSSSGSGISISKALMLQLLMR